MKKIGNSISNVSYPSSIFLLERYGTFAYERFAYNALDCGISALSKKLENEKIDVNMIDDSSININFSIGRFRSEDGYVIKTSAYTPPLLLAHCQHFGSMFNDVKDLKSFLHDPSLFKKDLMEFSEIVLKAFKDNSDKYISDWLKDLCISVGLNSISSLTNVNNYYDICSKMICYHEVAHAYTRQFYFKSILTQEEERAFEYAADLLSAEWTYNKLIKHTPDTDEYREFRDLDTYEDCIKYNYQLVMESYYLLLLFMGIARAINLDGTISLDGGHSHPNSLHRIIYQITHIEVFCMSNFPEFFTEEYVDNIKEYYMAYVHLFIESGFIQEKDVNQLAQFMEDRKNLKQIVKIYNIEELLDRV